MAEQDGAGTAGRSASEEGCGQAEAADEVPGGNPQKTRGRGAGTGGGKGDRNIPLLLPRMLHIVNRIIILHIYVNIYAIEPLLSDVLLSSGWTIRRVLD